MIMTHEKPHNTTPTDSTELDGARETATTTTIDTLPYSLGLVETNELKQLRGQFVETLLADGDVKDIATRYHLLAQGIVNQYEGADFARAQIALIVQMGLIARDGKRIDVYLENLEDALTYASNEGFEDITIVLQYALNTPPAQETSAGTIEPTHEELAHACKEVLSHEDCAELLAMPIDEALGYAFTLLIGSGVEDPEEFLKDKGILE